MRRALWLFALLLVAPSATAQTQPGLSLTLEPSDIIDAHPNEPAAVRVVVANHLERPVVVNLSAIPSANVKARYDSPLLEIPARASASATLTVLVPNATNVTHHVALIARETNASARNAPAPTAAPLEAQAKLQVRVPANDAPSVAAPRPTLAEPRVSLLAQPTSLALAWNGSVNATLTIANPTDKPILLAGENGLRFEAPPGIRVLHGALPETVGPKARVVVPFTIEHEGGGEPGARRVHAILGPARDPVRAPIDVRLAAPEPRASDVAPAATIETAPPVLDDRLVAGAAATAAVAGGWTALWLSRRHWWPLLLALYTRLRPSKMLDHPVRRRIAEVVQAQPGIGFSDLARAVGIAPGQLTHHARMLEKGGIVFSSPDGQTRRFFHVGSGRLAPVPPLGERALALLRSGPRTTSALARELGVSRQSLHYHVKQLVAEGKVVTRAEGREVWLEPAASQPSNASANLARS